MNLGEVYWGGAWTSQGEVNHFGLSELGVGGGQRLDGGRVGVLVGRRSGGKG